MTHLFWLSDDAWAAIEPHLPQGKPGKPRVDDRRVISGILHVLKTGCRWRDCPSKYGPHTTIYNRSISRQAEIFAATERACRDFPASLMRWRATSAR